MLSLLKAPTNFYFDGMHQNSVSPVSKDLDSGVEL